RSDRHEPRANPDPGWSRARDGARHQLLLGQLHHLRRARSARTEEPAAGNGTLGPALPGTGRSRLPDRLLTLSRSGPPIGWPGLMRFFARDKMAMVEPDTALPGRSEELRVPERHEVLGTPLRGPLPPGVETAIFGMGCFWGAERIFWQADGVYTTAVGYAGGVTPNPSYEETCSGMTGHSEVVLVAFDTAKTSYQEMLRLFWEGHDPTQGMRQGNDAGTQYR